MADFNLAEADDETIMRFANQIGYSLVTFDLDFGYLFWVKNLAHTSIVVLRLRDQTVESANATLWRLLQTGILDKKENRFALVVVDETSVRVRR